MMITDLGSINAGNGKEEKREKRKEKERGVHMCEHLFM